MLNALKIYVLSLKRAINGTLWLLLKSKENLDAQKQEKEVLREALAIYRSWAMVCYMRKGTGSSVISVLSGYRNNQGIRCLHHWYQKPFPWIHQSL